MTEVLSQGDINAILEYNRAEQIKNLAYAMMTYVSQNSSEVPADLLKRYKCIDSSTLLGVFYFLSNEKLSGHKIAGLDETHAWLKKLWYPQVTQFEEQKDVSQIAQLEIDTVNSFLNDWLQFMWRSTQTLTVNDLILFHQMYQNKPGLQISGFSLSSVMAQIAEVNLNREQDGDGIWPDLQETQQMIVSALLKLSNPTPESSP